MKNFAFYYFFAVPVIVLFTKADVLDAQTIEQLINTGMSIEDAADKAGVESVAKFQKNFGHQLYTKKYPPKTHIYFRGEPVDFCIYSELIPFDSIDMQYATSDCSLLLEQTAAVLSDDTILQLFLSVQQNHLSLSMQYAIER